MILIRYSCRKYSHVQNYVQTQMDPKIYLNPVIRAGLITVHDAVTKISISERQSHELSQNHGLQTNLKSKNASQVGNSSTRNDMTLSWPNILKNVTIDKSRKCCNDTLTFEETLPHIAKDNLLIDFLNVTPQWFNFDLKYSAVFKLQANQ